MLSKEQNRVVFQKYANAIKMIFKWYFEGFDGGSKWYLNLYLNEYF